jgi:hypothetical protein
MILPACSSAGRCEPTSLANSAPSQPVFECPSPYKTEPLHSTEAEVIAFVIRRPLPQHLVDLRAVKVLTSFFLLIFSPACLSAIAQQSSPGKENNVAGVNARGDQGMGFTHEETTHHFHLLADGGAIEQADRISF